MTARARADGTRRRANHQVTAPAAGVVNVVGGSGVEAVLANVADHADDGEPAGFGGERTEVDALAEGILAGQIAAGHGFVDEDILAAVIAGIEQAAGTQRDAHRGKITDAGLACFGNRAEAAGRQRLAFDLKPGGGTQAGDERKLVDAADRGDAGQGAYAVRHLFKLTGLLASVFYLLIVRQFGGFLEGEGGLIDLHGEDGFGPEPGIDGEYVLEAANQQAGADQGHQSEGDFRNYEEGFGPCRPRKRRSFAYLL